MLTSSLHREFSWSERALFLKEKLCVGLSKNTVTWSGWDCLCRASLQTGFPTLGDHGEVKSPRSAYWRAQPDLYSPVWILWDNSKIFSIVHLEPAHIFLEQYVLVFSYAKYEDHFVECQGSLSAPRARTPYVGLNLQHPKHRVDFFLIYLCFPSIHWREKEPGYIFK